MFNLIAAALIWQLTVAVSGQVVQESENRFTEEKCIELRDSYRQYVLMMSRGTGYVAFRGKPYSLADIDIECVRDTKGDV